MMKVINICKSIEPCMESGWSAYDMETDGKITEGVIRRIGNLGTLTYLGMLSQPFYRIEGMYYLIKGLERECHLRVSVLSGQEAFLNKVQEVLESESYYEA